MIRFIVNISILSFFLHLSLLPQAFPGYGDVLIHEDFQNLAQWRPLHFPKITQHTQYAIVEEEGRTVLKAESSASASALICKKEFSVFDYSRLKWKWRIQNVYEKGNTREKSGDDYPLRVYVIFKYDPDKASFGQKIKYGLAKKIYGEYPPHSSLNYIWANRNDEAGIVTNPFAQEVKMVILQSGPAKIGQWLEEDVNILGDYRKAFGTDPPAIASIAIMNDSDNTGEHSVSYIDYIEVYR